MSKEEYHEKFRDLDKSNLEISNYLNGVVKPYDVVTFMLSSIQTRGHFNFRAARQVLNGTSKP